MKITPEEEEEMMQRSSKFFAKTFLFLGFAFAALAAIPALRRMLTGATDKVFDAVESKFKHHETLEEKETPEKLT